MRFPKTKKYVTNFGSYTKEQIEKLEQIAKERGVTQSTIIREAIDFYLKEIKSRDLIIFLSLRKYPVIGLIRASRTIRIDQDERLKTLAEKTGGKVSELTREAIRKFLDRKFE